MRHRKLNHYLRLALLLAITPMLQNCSGDEGSDGESSKVSSASAPTISFSLVHGDPDDPDYVWADPDDPVVDPVPEDPVVEPDPDDQAGGEEPPPGEEPGSGDDDGEVAGPGDGGTDDGGGDIGGEDPGTDPEPGLDLALYCSDQRVSDLVFNFENLGCAGKKDSSSLMFSAGQHSLSDLMSNGLEISALKNVKVNTLFARLGADGNIVILDEDLEAGLRVPSGQSSGLKIKVHPTAHLKQGKTYIFKMKLKQSAKLKWHGQKEQCQMTPPHLDVVEVITKN